MWHRVPGARGLGTGRDARSGGGCAGQPGHPLSCSSGAAPPWQPLSGPGETASLGAVATVSHIVQSNDY